MSPSSRTDTRTVRAEKGLGALVPVLIAKDAVHEPLYVIVPLFNPWRWKSRYKHTDRAIKHFQDSGAVVVLVEAAFNRRDFVYADSGLDGTMANCAIHSQEFRHMYIPLRTKDELWLKENLVNVGAHHLPYGWEQMAWADSDILFVRPNWVGEAIHKLQHYKFIQMFSHARDLAPNYEILHHEYPHADGISFMAAYESGDLDRIIATASAPGKHPHHHPHPHPHPDPPPYYGDAKTSYPYGGRVWPGLAWACTKQAFEEVGGLLDFAVWGGGDWHMAHALIEKTEGMMRPDLHRNYRKMVEQWYYRCHTHIRRNVGMMEGTVLHNWHGRKTQRGYNEKHSLLAKIGFDPLRHLKRDYQGLYQLHDDRSTAYVQLRDVLRRIAKERNEDSIDVD